MSTYLPAASGIAWRITGRTFSSAASCACTALQKASASTGAISLRAFMIDSRRHLAERDRKAIPAIDRRDEQRQVDDFFFREVRLHRLPDGIGHVVLRNQREGFGPFERGALAVREEG